MYIVAVEGEPEKTLDLPGVYRVVALANPADGHPLTLDTRSLVAQLTRPKDESVLPRSTLDAMHVLVWGAATGQVKTYRFPGGPAIAATVRPGSEYKQPKREYGAVKQVRPVNDGSYRVRKYGR
jgi:hypothetical protein